MNTQHTPGPWRLKGTSADWFKPVANGQFVDLKQEANANLIAAAPDLLAALEAVMDRLVDKHEQDEAAISARAAIAKARGEV